MFIFHSNISLTRGNSLLDTPSLWFQILEFPYIQQGDIRRIDHSTYIQPDLDRRAEALEHKHRGNGRSHCLGYGVAKRIAFKGDQ